MFSMETIKLESKELKINNNPIDIVMKNYTSMGGQHIDIYFCIDIEKHDCCGRLCIPHNRKPFIEISTFKNIMETAQILAHELAHYLYICKKPLTEYEKQKLKKEGCDFTHDENWKKIRLKLIERIDLSVRMTPWI